MHSSVREIVTSEPDFPYFLRVDGKGPDLASGVQLLLSDGHHAWRGEASEESVCREAAELEMSKDEYVRDLRVALTSEGSSDSYRLALLPSPPDGGAALTLTYHKVLKDISFRLGSVTLSPVEEPQEAVRSLLTYSLETGSSLERQNRELRDQNRRLRREHQRINAELKRYATRREELEAELYSRFVAVLNEKKAKICSLREKLQAMPETEVGFLGEKTEDEEEYGGSTDEEAVCGEASAASPTPLDAGLSDITDVAPNRKRRFCHRAPTGDAVVKRAQSRRSSPPAATNPPPPPPRRPDEEEDLFEDF
ncbi:DNA repair protein XRCC4-like isoform X2 [Stigmatopora nigra]